MKTNYDRVLYIVDLIEEDLSRNYSMEMLAKEIGYSKYHMHKMFTNIVGMPLYQYIKKRRLSEAAKKLLCTDHSIIDIALNSGYESQQAFTDAFKKTFHTSPKIFRFKIKKFSLTAKYQKSCSLKGESIMDVRLEDCGEITLVGYSSCILKGLFVIPRLWKKLHKSKNKISNRVSRAWLFAFNDYENAEQKEDKGLSFDYYACIEVEDKNRVKENMVVKELPKSRYVVFSIRAKPQDSIELTIDYIYKEWFPSSTYQLNHQAKYDFVKYGEEVNEQGIADIEVWVPIL
ncbi:AraC family transcriptional regulator [Clostridium sp. 'deep sea']|uniref:AraC family transcriptional regulator n=1 Tax=Clostridium sp. 'deep sea' TaxID=2779445 RepID=UPI001896933B|nr:AraC family transcriptional regulator [Clostridium sp. 'deep sea']QOR36375.1 AraC family transcriptional regulator [Clostridium sp. 'deep sea']